MGKIKYSTTIRIDNGVMDRCLYTCSYVSSLRGYNLIAEWVICTNQFTRFNEQRPVITERRFNRSANKAVVNPVIEKPASTSGCVIEVGNTSRVTRFATLNRWAIDRLRETRKCNACWNSPDPITTVYSTKHISFNIISVDDKAELEACMN